MPRMHSALLRDTELGAARTGVALHLVCTWQNRFPGDDIEYRLLPARADRQVGRAGAPVRERGEHLLDDAILERVVADDRDPAARVEPADSGCLLYTSRW